MMDWFQRLMPRSQLFFPLFQSHATTVTAAAEALRRLLDGGADVVRHGRDIMRYEQEADAITREVLIGIRSTFITPFDRSDIKALIASMDDAIDEMQETVKAIFLFELDTFEPDMRAMADAIVQCARLVARAMPLLSNIGRNAGQLHEICLQVGQIEGQGDDIHDRGLKALYQKSKAGDPMEFVKGKEIYDLLEQVIDSFDDVCNQIEAVVIEHA
jgi:predicted phosphate transport protein (TIGR00153 family)